jgi:hypothetical protein
LTDVRGSDEIASWCGSKRSVAPDPKTQTAKQGTQRVLSMMLLYQPSEHSAQTPNCAIEKPLNPKPALHLQSYMELPAEINVVMAL